MRGTVMVNLFVVPLSCIVYRDPKAGKQYVFLTNNFSLVVRTIAAIYKERWQIGLFFRWVKQNLKIKTSLGASRKTLCMYLLIAYFNSRASSDSECNRSCACCNSTCSSSVI